MSRPAATPPETSPPEPPQTPRGLPAEVTMPLLDRITRQSLEEDYLHVAERKRAAGEDTEENRRSELRQPLTVAVLFAMALLVTLAGLETARDQDTVEAGRQELISRIETRQATVDDLHSTIAELSESNTSLDAEFARLGRTWDRLRDRRNQLAAETGYRADSGPGVLVTVDNAPGATFDDPGIVQDGDLAELVNGLWQAGATDIAINGQRVTARSALRNSGPVIRINGVSLSPPYEVVALGDTRTLQADFYSTGSGKTFHQITDQLDMPVTMEDHDELEVPAGPDSQITLTHATPITRTDQQEDDTP